ncbi:uncharacterized protein LOC118419477 isoform X2 [Branchiostoma floridae]|uniref:Uncharacterized protein LOC118419477 isoform X2 n=1 Tax=Branchiostoma floridae TaxID=7739 RepID=A0A9J7LF87_BRAFL|nr:uncharacterized protein LOC118419477 isoform X2 [Branchiostoma floridae]
MGYNGRVVSRVGAALAVCGGLSVVFGIAGDAAFPWSIWHLASAPIWSGVLVFITGCLGLTSGKQPTNKGAMAGFLSLAILSIITSLTQWILSALGLGVERSNCYWPVDYPIHCWRDGGSTAIHAVNLVLGLTECVLSFASSILCCVGLCTVPSQNPGTMVLYHAAPPQGGAPGQVAYFTTSGQVVSSGGQAVPVLMAAPGQAPPGVQYVSAGQAPPGVQYVAAGQAPPGVQYVATAGYAQPYPAAIATGSVMQQQPEDGAHAPSTPAGAPPTYTEKAPQ